VRGQHDGAAGALELLDELPQLAAGLGIEPGGGLVEEQQLRVADQRAGEGKALLLAAGQRADPGAALLFQLHEADDAIHRRAVAEEAAEQSHGLLDGELVRQLRLLQLDAEALLQRAGVGVPVHAQHLEIAGVARRQALAHLDGGGLAGAVGAEQSEAFAGEDLEVDAIDRDHIAVGLA
jgi:hypothetical protein